MTPPLAPVKGAQVSKVGRCQQRLSQKPQFVVFFGSLPLGKPAIKKTTKVWTYVQTGSTLPT